MSVDSFDRLEELARTGGAGPALEWLAGKFSDEKNYPALFETRLLQKRHQLELPLIPAEAAAELPAETRRAYDESFIAAAREVGALFLADGDIQRAWPYWRAIGESGPVAAAIERLEPGEGIEPIIEIAFQEGASPRKGFALILAHQGICRAISCFEQYPGRNGRPESLTLLVRSLHQELAGSLRRVIGRREGGEPAAGSVRALIEGRDWLFEDNAYYIDTSHLVAVLRYSLESLERETLELAVELAEYGARLSPMFEYRTEPPFERVYEDHRVYLRALLGQDLEAAVAHFRAKAEAADASGAGSGPAQVLVLLLARLGRHVEAIEASQKFLRGLDPSQLACPSVQQLCRQAGDYRRAMELAREQADLLHFAAAAIDARGRY